MRFRLDEADGMRENKALRLYLRGDEEALSHIAYGQALALTGPMLGNGIGGVIAAAPDGEIGTHRNQRMREREVSQRTPPFIEYGFITLCAGKSPVLFGQASLDFVFAMG